MKADAPADSTASLLTRVSFRDLYDLTKPRLTLMVLLTTVIGFIIASDGRLDLTLLIHTALGTALSAAGASALNQLIERRHDAVMQRTANRPIPAGRLATRDALAFGIASAAAGVAYLAITVNTLTAALSLATIMTYILLYTPLKRRTPLCTAVGAIPGALPIVMGWTAVTQRLDSPAWILFGILFCWQLPHFLAIAVIYLDDYARAGFPMLPVLDRSRAGISSEFTAPTTPQSDSLAPGSPLLPRGSATGRHAILWCLALLAVTLLPAFSGLAGPLYAAGAILLGLAYLAATLALAMQRTRSAARGLFLTSIAYLPALLFWLTVNKINPA